MITFIGHDKHGRYYEFSNSTEQDDFESYWNHIENYWDNPSKADADGDGCQGILMGMVGILILLAIIIALVSCAPPPQARLKQNPNITPYEYQLNSKRNIKRKYRKDFAPKKSLKPSLK